MSEVNLAVALALALAITLALALALNVQLRTSNGILGLVCHSTIHRTQEVKDMKPSRRKCRDEQGAAIFSVNNVNYFGLKVCIISYLGTRACILFGVSHYFKLEISQSMNHEVSSCVVTT